MSFATLEFWAFMAGVYALYLALPHRAQNRMLLVASYVFYGAWDWRFLSLIAASTVVDYVVARRLAAVDSERMRRGYLVVSLATNLGLLGFFKYWGFFTDSAQALAASFGVELGWTFTSIVLPVGISFYTFQTLSYTIDVYRRRIAPTGDFFDFALFVAFFPQLVAGPIERASHLLPEIQRPRRLDPEQIGRGLLLCLIGLVKKVAIADGVAGSVDAIYGSAGAVSGPDVVVATWLFAIQIYCDFSGYSDIARGLAKLMGFDLMVNFDLPYISTNPREFWRRWHMSLSTWLRDYLYIPLGGSRGGSTALYRNLLITMVLGGLWHGAAWNFVLWGAFHGVLLCAHRALGGGASDREPTPPARIVGALAFFQVTCYGWLLFRAESFEQVVHFSSLLFTGWGDAVLHVPRPPLGCLAGLALLVFLELSQHFARTPHFYRSWPEPVRGALVAALCFILLLGASNAPGQFIYFQF